MRRKLAIWPEAGGATFGVRWHSRNLMDGAAELATLNQVVGGLEGWRLRRFALNVSPRGGARCENQAFIDVTNRQRASYEALRAAVHALFGDDPAEAA